MKSLIHLFTRPRGVLAVLLAALAFGLAPAAQPAAAAAGANIVVTTQSNDIDVNGNCTLYEAISAVNTNTAQDACPAGTNGVDQITFAPGVTAIDNGFAPFVGFIQPVIVDGSVGGVPTVTLTNVRGSGMIGLMFLAGSNGSTLRGMKLAGFDLSVSVQANNVTVVNNWIGTTDGVTAAGSLGSLGIEVLGKNARIGSAKGAAAPEGNLIVNQDTGIYIGQSASNTVIQGNKFGVTASGMAALPNHVGITDSGTKTLIGGKKPGQGNIIAASTSYGILLSYDAVKTTVQRNLIGMAADRISPLPNQVGILAYSAQGALIGGPMPSASNIIAGNTTGIRLEDNGVSPKTMLTLTGNVIGLNGGGDPLPNTTGIDFNLGAQTMKVKVNGNLIAGNTTGLRFNNAFAPIFIGSTNNCIRGNTSGLDDTTTETVTSVFEKNWWGHFTGPSGSYGGIGDTANTSFVDIDPFLTKPPSSCLGYTPRSTTPKPDGFAGISSKPTKFKWSKVPTAASYLAGIGTGFDASGPTGLIDFAMGPAISFTTSAPLTFGRYYWQVNTLTADGIDWQGQLMVYDVTIQKSPKPGATLKAGSPVKFVWGKYPDATSYDLVYFVGSSDCSGTPTVVPGLSDLPTTVMGLTSGIYAWHVQPDNGPSMPCWSFSITN
jgi:hypothetical protein